MKNFFLLTIIALTVLTSCNMGPSATELKQKNDSLFLASAEKDRRFNELVESLVEIDENLSQIKEKENIIALNAAEANNEKINDKINQDIKDIYQRMVENQEKIANLEKMLRKSGRENANMQKLIESLNNQLKEKSVEIVQLNEQLKQKNFEIADLSYAIDGLQHVLDSIRVVNLQTNEKLEQTTTDLFKAYYVVGTSKELKDKKIVNMEGFLNMKKSVLTKDFDSSYFEEIDTRNASQIATNSKKIKILSSHPENSYKLDTDSEGIITITILNSDTFWSVSKFLVVQAS